MIIPTYKELQKKKTAIIAVMLYPELYSFLSLFLYTEDATVVLQ